MSNISFIYIWAIKAILAFISPLKTLLCHCGLHVSMAKHNDPINGKTLHVIRSPVCVKVTVIVSTATSSGLRGVTTLLLSHLSRAYQSHSWACCRGAAAGSSEGSAASQICWRLRLWGCLCPLKGILLQNVNEIRVSSFHVESFHLVVCSCIRHKW